MSLKSARGQGVNGGTFRNFTATNEYGGGFFARGGDTVTEVAGYMVHKFNASANFIVSFGKRSLEYIVIGGGGGGGMATEGSNEAGAGGGGGQRRGTTVSVLGVGTYPVTVGAGGNAGGYGGIGQRGGQSAFGDSNSNTAFVQVNGGGGGGFAPNLSLIHI